MSEGHWARVEELFHRAALLSEAERHSELPLWCGDDAELYGDVVALLTSDSVIERLLADASPPPGEHLLRAPAGDEAQSQDHWLGRMVGPFFLERVLGRGGMGVVYLGRRRDDAMAQTVAVKLIARHLRHSPAVGQFLAERHVLGRLEHRHIARLIDGGLEDGAPYVAMEYVDGRRLDEVCDEPATDVVTKIGLMLQLCEAVAYVHGQLILHRDLKPGNVLVTAAGQVKLLDFGTIKMMDIEAADSLMTRAGMRAVTLRYASPEHVAGKPVSTATDIYSLGVILYRIIRGRAPRDRETPDGPQDGAVGAVPESTGAAPSSSRALLDDLDAIAAKAMREEPGQRYSSVDALAEDLRNALGHRPVQARAGNRRYRAGKFIARHRPAILAVAAVLATLAVGVAAVQHEGAVARAESRRAEAGVEDERKLAHLLLFDYFEELKRIPGSTDAQHRAVSRALAYLDGLVQGAASSALTRDRVEAYTKLGNLLGSPYEENIGDGDGAIRTLEKAVLLSRQLVADNPTDLHSLESSSAAQMALGRVYFGSGAPQQAVKFLRPAADISERIAATPGVDAATVAQAASVVDSLGDVYGQDGAVTLGDPATAIVTYRKAQAIDAAGLKLDAGCARCRRGVALEYWKIGMLTEAIDQDEAAAIYSSGLDTLAEFAPADQATVRVRRLDTVLRQRLGSLLIAAGRTEDGIAMLSEVQQRFEAAVTADPTDARARFDLAALDASLADGYEHAKRMSDVLATDREYLASMEFLIAQDPKNVTWRFHGAGARIRVGRAQMQLKETGPGRSAVEDGLAALLPLAQSATADTNILSLAATTLNELHREPALALGFAERALGGQKAVTAEVLITLARAQREAGHAEDARTTAQQALTVLAVHPKSVGNAEQTAAARRIVTL